MIDVAITRTGMGGCSSLVKDSSSGMELTDTLNTSCPDPDAEGTRPSIDAGVVNLGENAPLACVRAHAEEINCLAVSADASLVASGSEDCSVRVWSTDKYECVRELLGHNDYITCLVFAGQDLLSGSGDMTVKKWDLILGECIFTITGQMGSITSVRVTRTQIFTSGSDSLVHCWSLDDGTLIREYEGHTDAVYGIAFYTGSTEAAEVPDSTTARRRVRFVTFSADATARLWNATRSTSLQTFGGHSGPVTCVAVDEERHYLFTGSSDGRIASWLIETGQRIHWFEGHSAPVIDLLLSGDYLYSASSDETARSWVTDVAQELKVFKRHAHTVTALALRGEILITASGDGVIRCFDTKTAIIQKSLTCPDKGKFTCFEMIDNNLIAGAHDGQICAWDLQSIVEKDESKEQAS